MRIAAACCGIVGLKTTFGRVSLTGVWPLGRTLDTVGPMARDIAGVELGMQLLEPGFARSSTCAVRVGRIATVADPVINAAIDRALLAAGFEVVNIEPAEIEAIGKAFATLYFAEAWNADHHLLDTRPQGLGAEGHRSPSARSSCSDRWRATLRRPPADRTPSRRGAARCNRRSGGASTRLASSGGSSG